MISAPGMGCWSSRVASKASAGGQLEQPSEVKSSTTTGEREDWSLAAASRFGEGATEKDMAARVAIAKNVGVECFTGGWASLSRLMIRRWLGIGCKIRATGRELANITCVIRVGGYLDP